MKLGLPCQILGQFQSRPPAQPLSCLGRSLSHSVGCLTAWMATRCLRLVAWTWSGLVWLFHSVGSSQSSGDAPMASSLCCGSAGCLTASGSQGISAYWLHLLPHWVIWLLGRVLSHLGLPSFTGWMHLGGCSVARESKIQCSYPSWQSCNCRGKFSMCWCSLPGKMLFSWQRTLQMVLDSRGLLRFFCSFYFTFCCS